MSFLYIIILHVLETKTTFSYSYVVWPGEYLLYLIPIVYIWYLFYVFNDELPRTLTSYRPYKTSTQSWTVFVGYFTLRGKDTEKGLPPTFEVVFQLKERLVSLVPFYQSVSSYGLISFRLLPVGFKTNLSWIQRLT